MIGAAAICVIVAIVLFALATIAWPPAAARFNLVAAGLGFLALSILLQMNVI